MQSKLNVPRYNLTLGHITRAQAPKFCRQAGHQCSHAAKHLPCTTRVRSLLGRAQVDPYFQIEFTYLLRSTGVCSELITAPLVPPDLAPPSCFFPPRKVKVFQPRAVAKQINTR